MEEATNMKKFQKVTTNPRGQEGNDSIMSWVLTWMLLPLLVYFAIGGYLRLKGSADAYLEMSTAAKTAGDGAGTASKAIGLLLLALVSALILGRAREIINICRQHMAFLFLSAWAVASALWSPAPLHTAMNAVYATTTVLFAFYLCARIKPAIQLSMLELAGWATIILSMIASVVFPAYGRTNIEAGATAAWVGIFPHKNICAITLLYLIPIPYFIRAKGLVSVTSRTVYVLAGILVIAMTQSKTGLLFIPVICLYVILTRITSRMVAKERILLYATGATVASAIGVLVASNYGLLLTLIGKDSTLTGRTDIWKSVLASAMKHPVLGYGYSAFLLSTESSNVTMALRHATNAIDNGYLVVWLELGAVGLSLFGYTLIRVLKDAVFCLNSSANPYVAFYVLVVLLTAIGNVTEAYIMSSNRLVWIMYVMACVVLNSEAKRIRRQGLA